MAVLPGGLGEPHREGAIQAGPCEVSGLCLDKGGTGSGTLRELARDRPPPTRPSEASCQDQKPH